MRSNQAFIKLISWEKLNQNKRNAGQKIIGSNFMMQKLRHLPMPSNFTIDARTKYNDVSSIFVTTNVGARANKHFVL